MVQKKKKQSAKLVMPKVSDHFYNDVYQEVTVLGEGGFGKVVLAVCTRGNCEAISRAVKLVDKAKHASRLDMIKDEIARLHHLSQKGVKNVPKFVEWFDEVDKICIVQEYVPGETLEDFLRKTKYNEAVVQRIMIHLIRVLKDCKDLGAVHRDITPKNILVSRRLSGQSSHLNDLETKDKLDELLENSLKVIDFGLSKLFEPREVSFEEFSSYVGTPYYMAPEVVLLNDDGVRTYDVKCDAWSVGIICYRLLSGGTFPFQLDNNSRFENKESWKEQLRNFTLIFMPADNWVNISPDAKDFVKGVLEKDSTRRLSYVQMLNHKWLKKDAAVLPRELIQVNKFREIFLTKEGRKEVKITVAVSAFGSIMNETTEKKIVRRRSEKQSGVDGISATINSD